VRGNKNDHNDAFAITEANQRPYIWHWSEQIETFLFNCSVAPYFKGLKLKG
jgi:hypothetical protein